MATTNSLFYDNPKLNQKIFFDTLNNSLTLSGVSLKLDANLNQDVITRNAVPYSPSAPGIEGQMAYDDNHLYLCVRGGSVGNANWVRSRLTNWYIEDIESNGIPTPQYWWSLTGNASSILPIEYNFTAGYPGGGYTFSQQDGLSTIATPGGCLFNHTSPNFVEQAFNNPQSFSISFETKRTVDYSSQPYAFLLGNPFGMLGFHFEFVNSNHTAKGNHISFSLGLHEYEYTWVRAISPSPLNLNTTYQIVGVHDYFGISESTGLPNGRLKLYINNSLVATSNYNGNIWALYTNPWYQGCGLGCSTTSPGRAEYFSQIKLKNLGFWNNKVLSQNAISALYNGGNFRSYPFVQ